MNRLILIGNGFDLAHGLKTGYNDFILDYLISSFTAAHESGAYRDELLEIICDIPNAKFGLLTSVSDFLNTLYEKGLDQIFAPQFAFTINPSYRFNPFRVNSKSVLLNALLKNCSNSNWVDVENEFYKILKEIMQKNKEDALSSLSSLNNSLLFLIKKLKDYLSNIDGKSGNFIKVYSDIFKYEINHEEIPENFKVDDIALRSIMILNFNYTYTPKNYAKNAIVNHIHGELNNTNNPIIFGFGDELDEDYHKMELENRNDYFKFIKSFGYFKTSNYHNLIRFIDSDIYQVYILGHSCGLSDRTMLNMIFEHDNCKSIKIFYHGTKEKNNYENLTMEISRHFKDKTSMRRKIVSLDKCESMPQLRI